MDLSTGAPELPGWEHCFRSVFAHAAIGMAIIDGQGTIVYANQALCQMSGYGEEELCRMHFTETLHPEDRESRREIFRKILTGEIGSFINERRMLRKDGTVAWARTSVTVPSQWSGEPQVIAFVEDITERKQTEDALRASEERFRIAAESASDVIYEWDLGSGEVSVFGIDNQRLGDWPCPRTYPEWETRVHPEDMARLRPEFTRHVQSGERYSGEFRVVGKTGKIFHYSNRGQAIRNAAGEPCKWVGVACDITESKLAEEAISQLAAIVECSESAIFATDLNGNITTWNRGAEKLSGYTGAEARRLPVAALFPSEAETLDILAPIEHGEAARLDEASLRRKDGGDVPVLLTVSPIRKPGGQLAGSAIIARDIRERKEAEKEMAYRALHDHLTGLPNRQLLGESLAESMANNPSGSGIAVIFVDLDGFKFVNDSLGHESGDVLLQQVGQRLAACVRRGDLLGRTGGDEFMLVAKNVREEHVAQAIAERLRTALREPFFVAQHELVITASMGISLYPRDGADARALRRNADTAMYEAKQSGKDRVRFYRPALSAAFQSRMELEADLRHAIGREELRLYYQPVYTADEGRLTAFEALSRWPHPKFGLLTPDQFIPLAEETGLIIRLGEWVLREACRQCRWWQDHGNSRGVRVAVNVSPLQFARPDFIDTVLAALEDSGLAGSLLDLELTESIVMRDVESAIEKMARLREHGVRISVDDFGTGYSSLGYLPRLPIDIVKIDRCFVALIGENDAAVRLIHGMISLAHSIGIRVIVEGVETAEQLEILRALGCDEVQGYLLGCPSQAARSQASGAPETLIA